MRKGDWGTLQEMWRQLGQPQVYYLFYGLNAIAPDFITGYRVFTVLCMLAIAASLYSICRRAAKLPCTESGFIAAFVATWPFYNVFLSEALLHYVTSFALFYVGWALYFYGREQAKTGAVCSAFLLIGISCFTINSLIAFYYGFVLLYFLFHSAFKNLVPFVKQHWFLITFPVLLFAAKTILCRPYGMYEGYNAPVVLGSDFAQSLSQIGHNTYVTVFSFNRIYKVFRIVCASAWPILPFILAALYAAIRAQKNDGTSGDMRRHIIMLVGLGVVFSLLAAVPYAVAGKYLYGGWGERHGILLAPGLALIFAAFGIWITQAGKPKLSALLYAFLLLISSSTLNYRYLMWQARGLLDQSVMENLTTLTPPPANALVLYSAPEEYIIDSYRTYELSGMLYAAWKKEQWYVLPQVSDIVDSAPYLASYPEISRSDFEKKVQLVGDYTPGNCVALLRAELTIPYLSRSAALKGYYYRTLFRQSEIVLYISNLFTITVTPANERCKF